MPKTNGIEILLVEDSPSDAFISAEALKQAKELGHVHVVHDGVEAMAFLRHQSPYADVPRPDLVLLDLNMPRKDGREVLAEMKTDTELCKIPVIVLSSSSAEQDISNAYSLHANCYLTKPADFGRFKEMIMSIESFWFQQVTLPPHE